MLESRSIDIDARSRRHNLIFRGISDVLKEVKCVEMVILFILDNLGIETDMFIQKVHGHVSAIHVVGYCDQL